jgi:hypothetical protein
MWDLSGGFMIHKAQIDDTSTPSVFDVNPIVFSSGDCDCFTSDGRKYNFCYQSIIMEPETKVATSELGFPFNCSLLRYLQRLNLVGDEADAGSDTTESGKEKVVIKIKFYTNIHESKNCLPTDKHLIYARHDHRSVVESFCRAGNTHCYNTTTFPQITNYCRANIGVAKF